MKEPAGNGRRWRRDTDIGTTFKSYADSDYFAGQDLPVVIEIVDAEDKISAFISEVMALTKSCLITTEKVRIIRYGEGE
jgi:PII-like signaling protein